MKYKYFLISLLLFLSGSLAFAQKNEISPYSRFGYGVEREGKFLRNFGLASSGIALESGVHVNPMNPASYSGLTLTAFEAGFQIDNLWLTGGGQSQYQNNAYFSHLLFGIPVIANRWGMTFGMMPVTSVGYEFQQGYTLDEIGTVTNTFDGQGGINRLLFGHGVKIFDNDSSELRVGVNLNYYLGTITKEERIIYDNASDIFNTWKLEETNFGDFRMDFGVQYATMLGNGLELISGVTFAYEDQVGGQFSSAVLSYTGNVGFERLKDTVSFVEDQESQFRLPATYGGGITLKKADKWQYTLDATFKNWSAVQSDTLISFSNAMAIRTGYEFYRGDTRKKDGKLRVYDLRTRFGARYNSSFITIDGEQLQEIAGSIGFSFYNISRVNAQRLVRGLNFGMEIGTRGKDSGAMFKEEFVNFMLGISIDDRWFIKRKYD